MALPDLKGQQIQRTYQRVVQTDGTKVYDGTGSLLPISFDGNNVTISGSLTATEYSVTSSVTNVIFQQQSGSTIFGDSLDDTHLFTGSLNITGAIDLKGDSLYVGQNEGVIYNGSNRLLLGATSFHLQTAMYGNIFAPQLTLGSSANQHVTTSGNLWLSGSDGINDITINEGVIQMGNGSTNIGTSIRSSYFTAGWQAGYKIGNGRQAIKMDNSETIMMFNSNDGPLEISGSAVDIKGPLTASIDGGTF
tara:strand:+ start:504 stop:1250 length:747 start_codon:yes stop_codon:yes gene_type:complete